MTRKIKHTGKLGSSIHFYLGGITKAVRLRAGKSYLERAVQHVRPLELRYNLKLTKDTNENQFDVNTKNFWPWRTNQKWTWSIKYRMNIWFPPKIKWEESVKNIPENWFVSVENIPENWFVRRSTFFKASVRFLEDDKTN